MEWIDSEWINKLLAKLILKEIPLLSMSDSKCETPKSPSLYTIKVANIHVYA